MMQVRLAIVLGVLVAFQTGPLAGQTPRPAPGTLPVETSPIPPRDPSPGRDARVPGNSAIRGRVVVAGTGAPVRGAQVVASADQQRRGTAVTDDQGAFEIRGLAAGRYTVIPTKRGLFAPGFDGGQRSRSRPLSVEIGEGQTIEKLTVVMERGGVIAGRILDDYGEPMAGVEVNAMRYQYNNGRRELMRVFSPGMGGPGIRTDDLGAYRLYGLAAGQYVVGAQPPREFMMVPEPAATSAAAPASGPGTTFFPGTPDRSQARAVAVRAGQETSGIDFTLVRQRMARIRGAALNSRGLPMVGARVMLTSEDRAFGMIGGGGSGVGADGTFSVSGVAPGAYTIVVQTGMGFPAGDNDEMGFARVTVAGEDVEGLLITASRGGTLRGRLLIDGEVPVGGATYMVTVEPLGETRVPMGPGRAQLQDDGTFELKNLHGRVTLRSFGTSPTAASAVAGTGLLGVFHNGADVTDTGFEFTSGEVIDSVEIVLTRKLTEITGRVLDDRGAPPETARVVIYAGDRERWTPRSRYIRSVGTDAEGRYRLRGLPPSDEYLIAVVPSLESGQEFDPEFLASLINVSERLTLREAETKTHDLRVQR